MNLSRTIVPKSDQLNADDLIAGPRTIKITAVESGSAEQPVLIRYEGENGRPYKPSKSMRRVLVVLWGDEGDAYVGQRITLYRDPLVKFGGDSVGGIKISHASNIDPAGVSIALTETRGKRKPHRVELLAEEKPQFDLQSLIDVGDTKAREGADPLKQWWTSLPREQQHALKAKLPEWKKTAEGKAAA